MSQDTQDKIASLESELLEKEELIVALTERLEQAAEQLDRFHRTGADRGTRTAGGIPVELLEQQKKLTEELQQAVERWETMQAAVGLQRLEAQISDLRDLVGGREGWGEKHGEGLEQRQPHFRSDDESAEASDIPLSEEAPAEGYEAIKNALLENDNDAPPAEVNSYSATEIQDELDKIEPVDPPDEIDVLSADLEDLRRAVEERDSYVGWLIKRLRVFESCRRLPEDWEGLGDAPEEMKRRFESLEHQLQATLRLAEVEHSLERARLSREETRIKQMEQQLQKEIRKLGLDHMFPAEYEDAEYHDEPYAPYDATGGDEQSETVSTKGVGWLSFLSGVKNANPGRNHEDDAS